ncbi:MAG: MobA/MobL family protein [Azonexus sp.]|jgi:cell division protein FtsB|uniref:MobA/MobL family protein n=1 Tax=Azonexus sp. TaxID=1872668 RepID=UPI00282D3507|nr:MobA/MobL family protein [Azonexus sp.]MDR0776859.1 MobA/MobL family protein [Azonexus sp.]
MATYFLRTRTGKAATGAGHKHALYISGQDKYADKNEVLAVVDKNLPVWAKDGIDFFKKADENERSNGRSYRTLIIAIPREAADKLKWAQDLTDALLEDKHAYRLAIHDKGDGNPHMHLMFTERGRNFENSDDPKDYFTRNNAKDKKFSGTKSKAWLKDAKALYLSHVQKAAPDYRWKPAEPNSQEPHIGPKVKNASFEFEVERIKRQWRVNELRDAKKDVVEYRALQAERDRIKAEIATLEGQQSAAGQRTKTAPSPRPTARPTPQPAVRRFAQLAKRASRQTAKVCKIFTPTRPDGTLKSTQEIMDDLARIGQDLANTFIQIEKQRAQTAAILAKNAMSQFQPSASVGIPIPSPYEPPRYRG